MNTGLAQAAGVAGAPAAGAAPAAGTAPAGGAPAAGNNGSSAPAPGPSGNGSGGQAPGAGAASTPAASQGDVPYRPEGLPDHLLGASDRETLDRVFKAFDGYRRTEAERGAVPDKPEGYQFTPSETVKAVAGDLTNDELMKKVQARAHAAKLPVGQFNAFLNGVMEDMISTGGVGGVDYAKEIEALIPDDAKNLDETQRKAAASKRIGANLAFIEGAKQQMVSGGMSKDAAEEISTTLLARLGDDAKGQRAIEWIRAQGGQAKPAMNGGAPSSGITKADLDMRNADERNDPNSSKFDRAFAMETRRLFKELYPG